MKSYRVWTPLRTLDLVAAQDLFPLSLQPELRAEDVFAVADQIEPNAGNKVEQGIEASPK